MDPRALRALVTKQPQDGKAVSRLAVLLEESDRVKAAVPLLRAAGPEALKATEGARILGQFLAAKGEIEAAHALLLPYVEDRLKTVKKLEARLVSSYQTAEKAAYASLTTATPAALGTGDTRRSPRPSKS